MTKTRWPAKAPVGWIQRCWDCGTETSDWLTMTVSFPDGLSSGAVPLCSGCEIRFRDRWKEKGE